MIHKLYNATGTGDAVLTWICPEDTTIEAIRWCANLVGPVDGGVTQYELSFAATNQHTLNDVTNIIDVLRMSVEITTSGGLLSSVADFHYIPGGVPVEAGEKIYLHVLNGNSGQNVAIILYTSARRANKSSSRRR